jgi:four helix bundle protein
MGFRFRNFEIYKDTRVFVKEIYKLASKLPKDELFGLNSQLKRAATSILLNIAEGSMKKSDPEFNRFILISIGSVSEVAAILDVCSDQKYINSFTHEDYVIKCETIAKRLYGLSKVLKKSKNKP